jgi:uncharacterized SAM-binding protein YcdF (DUF218 family)
MGVRAGSLVGRVVGALVLAVVLLVVSTATAIWWTARQDSRPSADAIVVLGSAQYNGRPSSIFEARLEHAIALYEDGVAPVIVTVGGRAAGDEFTEAEAGAMYLVGSGIPEEAVATSPEGGTSLESLRAAASIMREQDMDSAFLVSDPWHNLRIRRMARDLGIDGYVSATWHSAAESQSTRLQGYARETFAYLYYRVFGR